MRSTAGVKVLLTCLAACWAAEAAGQQTILERQQAMFSRNVGTAEQQRAQFPPHRIVGNLYYVGSQSLASFLVATPDGHILINTNWEDGVPNLRKSVEDLGFDFEDIEIVLGSHAHADHMEGDAAAKQATGAQVMAMAEDVPALERMRPGGKPHPIDRVLHDGDTVTLGKTTLVAHLTPGHTKGCTTWTMKATENGRTYDVVIIGSVGVNPGFVLVGNKDYPQIADDYVKSFKVMRSLPVDVFLGAHGAFYGMTGKHKQLEKGGPNPFIDPEGFKTYVDRSEQAFLTMLEGQKKAETK